MVKRALITGITGQDGAYLADFLLKKGYEVHGVIRRSSLSNIGRLAYLQIQDRIHLHCGDMTDGVGLMRIISQVQPDELYNLAAQSDVAVSFEAPEYTANTDALGVLRVLEAVRIIGLSEKTKIYQASTSELFGKVQEIPQKETTPFYPRSPYAAAKAYAYWMILNYRESYNMFACNGILFNHESPLRGHMFVTRKITQAVARIIHGQQKTLAVGNLSAMRDWGYAPDYVEAMWLMLQQSTPDDFVIATGQSHTVRQFIEYAFKYVGITISWSGSGLDERGIDRDTGKTLVAVDARYFRPAEVDFLLGDATKAQEVLGWRSKTSFQELVSLMMQADINFAAHNASVASVECSW